MLRRAMDDQQGVHYSQWANLQNSEFATVAGAFQQLLKSMHCSKCGELVYVSPVKGEK
jgi:hypothetical protein